jgi:hypothetical protein
MPRSVFDASLEGIRERKPRIDVVGARVAVDHRFECDLLVQALHGVPNPLFAEIERHIECCARTNGTVPALRRRIARHGANRMTYVPCAMRSITAESVARTYTLRAMLPVTSSISETTPSSPFPLVTLIDP